MFVLYMALINSVEDPHHVFADPDPDPTILKKADPDPDPAPDPDPGSDFNN